MFSPLNLVHFVCLVELARALQGRAFDSTQRFCGPLSRLTHVWSPSVRRDGISEGEALHGAICGEARWMNGVEKYEKFWPHWPTQGCTPWQFVSTVFLESTCEGFSFKNIYQLQLLNYHFYYHHHHHHHHHQTQRRRGNTWYITST